MFLFVGLFTSFTLRQDTEKWHTVRDESGNHTRTAKSKTCPDILTSHSVIKWEMLIALSLTNHHTRLQLQKEEAVPHLAPPSSHRAPRCWSPGTYATHPASPWERHPRPCASEHPPGCSGLQRCLGLSEKGDTGQAKLPSHVCHRWSQIGGFPKSYLSLGFFILISLILLGVNNLGFSSDLHR